MRRKSLDLFRLINLQLKLSNLYARIFAVNKKKSFLFASKVIKRRFSYVWGYEWKGWWYEALIGHGLMNLFLSAEAIKTKPSSSRSINECPHSNNIISIHKRNFTYYIHFPSLLPILQTIITLYRHRPHMTWSLILANSDFATKPFECAYHVYFRY